MHVILNILKQEILEPCLWQIVFKLSSVKTRINNFPAEVHGSYWELISSLDKNNAHGIAKSAVIGVEHQQLMN